MHVVAFFFLALQALYGMTDGEMRDTLAGKVPTRSESFTNERGKSVGRGWGAIVIERPIAEVWSTLIRYEDRAEYVPRVKEVTVLERQPGMMRAKQVIDASVMTARYTAWFRLDEKEHQ